MLKIVPIVEGLGEVKAIPALCNKLLQEKQRYDVQIDEPFDAKGCKNLIKRNGLEELVRRAWNRQGCDAILILVDADDACAETLAQSFTKRILALGTPRCTVVTVVAVMEYEAWFLASIAALAGKTIRDGFTLPTSTTYNGNVEAKRDVKKWLTDQVPLIGGKKRVAYDEARDQLAMTRLIDPEIARANSRSFRRLCHALEQILDAVDNNKIVVTPEAR